MVELTQMRPAAGFLALSLGLGLAACSSGSGGGTETEAVGCATDPRVQTLTEGMTHKGDSGKFSFTITKADYMPPAAETNIWTVEILDANGKAVKDATLTFPANGHPSDPWMPDHPHGDIPAKAVNNNDGTYTVSPLYFFMGGVWSTYILAQSGSITDGTTFTVCVGG